MNINFYIICDDDNLYINNKLQKINKKLKNKYKNVYLFKSITNKNIKTYLNVNKLIYDFNNIDLKNNINYYNILKNHDKSKHVCIIPSNINDINNILFFINYLNNLNNLSNLKINDYDIINIIYNKDTCIFINSNIISDILKENINIKYDNYKNTTILLNNLKNIIDNDDTNDDTNDDKNDINQNDINKNDINKNDYKNNDNLPLTKKNTNSNKFKNLNRHILRRR